MIREQIEKMHVTAAAGIKHTATLGRSGSEIIQTVRRKFIAAGRTRKALSIIETLADRLNTIGPHYERPFLDLGEQLQTAWADAQQLAERTRTSVRFFSGADTAGDLPARITALAADAEEELEKSRQAMTFNLDALNDSIEHLAELNLYCTKVEKVALFFRIIGFNIGVECARSEEGRTMFQVLAEEIQKLSGKINRIVIELRDESETALKDQQKAHWEVSLGFKKADQLAQKAHQAVKAAADNVQHMTALAVQTLDKAAEHSTAISAQVGEVVAGIQFHDNMAQRLEHMVAALTDILNLCRNTSSPGAPAKVTERLMTAHTVVTLQKAQLEQVIDETRQVYGQNRDAFTSINDQVQRLLADLKGLEQPQPLAGDQTDSFEDAFKRLHGTLDTLHRLLGGGADMLQRVRGTLGNAERSAQVLQGEAGKVRRISLAVHIMALNAIIKAAHMGEKGRTLEVLARQVRQLSSDCNNFVNKVQVEIEAISAARAKVGTASASETDESKQSVEDGMTCFAQAYDGYREETAKGLDVGKTLKARIDSVQHHMAFFDTLGQEFDRSLALFTELEHCLAPWAAAGVAGGHDKAAKLAASYTMDQERKVHEQMLGTISTEAGAIDLFDDEPANEADDVVLFDCDEPATGSDTTASEPNLSPPAEDNIAEIIPCKGSEEEKDDDLGDNVELF